MSEHGSLVRSSESDRVAGRHSPGAASGRRVARGGKAAAALGAAGLAGTAVAYSRKNKESAQVAKSATVSAFGVEHSDIAKNLVVLGRDRTPEEEKQDQRTIRRATTAGAGVGGAASAGMGLMETNSSIRHQRYVAATRGQKLVGAGAARTKAGATAGAVGAGIGALGGLSVGAARAHDRHVQRVVSEHQRGQVSKSYTGEVVSAFGVEHGIAKSASNSRPYDPRTHSRGENVRRLASRSAASTAAVGVIAGGGVGALRVAEKVGNFARQGIKVNRGLKVEAYRRHVGSHATIGGAAGATYGGAVGGLLGSVVPNKDSVKKSTNPGVSAFGVEHAIAKAAATVADDAAEATTKVKKPVAGGTLTPTTKPAAPPAGSAPVSPKPGLSVGAAADDVANMALKSGNSNTNKNQPTSS